MVFLNYLWLLYCCNVYFQYDDVHFTHLSLLANYAGRRCDVPHYFCNKNCLEIKSTVTHEMETGSALMVCNVAMVTAIFCRGK